MRKHILTRNETIEHALTHIHGLETALDAYEYLAETPEELVDLLKAVVDNCYDEVGDGRQSKEYQDFDYVILTATEHKQYVRDHEEAFYLATGDHYDSDDERHARTHRELFAYDYQANKWYWVAMRESVINDIVRRYLDGKAA